MSWVRLDDHFDEHPKLQAVGPLGVALFVTGLAYCNRNLTDGFIPWGAARALLCWEFLDAPAEDDDRRRVCKVCVTSGMKGQDATAEFVISLLLYADLWEEVEDGYQVHDYTDYQPSRAEIQSKTAVKASAGRLGGIRSGEVRSKNEANRKQKRSKNEAKTKPKPNPNPVPNATNRGSSNNVRRAKTTAPEVTTAATFAERFKPNGEIGGPLGLYLQAFQFINPVQRRLLEQMVADVGEEIGLAAVNWAAGKHQSDVNAIVSCANTMKREGLGPKAEVDPLAHMFDFTEDRLRDEAAKRAKAAQGNG